MTPQVARIVGFAPKAFRPFSNWSIPVPGGAFGLQGDRTQTALVFGRYFKGVPLAID